MSSVVVTEALALRMLSQALHEGDLLDHLSSLKQSINTTLENGGKVFFTGLGKSGHLAHLLAATFSSLSIPSCTIHPTEALHGDLGMVASNDLLIALSKSGSGSELEVVISRLHARGVHTVLWSCKQGPLYSLVEHPILLPLVPEADQFDIVPTSSLIMMLSFGHHVALSLFEEKSGSVDQFGENHPGGSIGKQLGA